MNLYRPYHITLPMAFGPTCYDPVLTRKRDGLSPGELVTLASQLLACSSRFPDKATAHHSSLIRSVLIVPSICLCPLISSTEGISLPPRELSDLYPHLDCHFQKRIHPQTGLPQPRSACPVHPFCSCLQCLEDQAASLCSDSNNIQTDGTS